MSHGDAVTEIPADFIRTGTSADCPFASIENPDKKIYGIQFHPEVRHSVHGYDILRNFALNICGAKGDWTMDNFIDMQIKKSYGYAWWQVWSQHRQSRRCKTFP